MHIHNWSLDSPSGKYSIGKCNGCEKERNFLNYIYDAANISEGEEVAPVRKARSKAKKEFKIRPALLFSKTVT